MQLMPNTAKKVSKNLKIKYSLHKLKNNKNYNIKIGVAYLEYLLNKFDNSKILIIASYNAGPNSAKRWIKENGDVRKLRNIDEIIDWIESITYYETRNYVQRIIENINIYNQLN
jgi:soluble lytic murein transglycosylase